YLLSRHTQLRESQPHGANARGSACSELSQDRPVFPRRQGMINGALNEVCAMIVSSTSRRRAATLAESAFAYSTVFLLTLGLILAALGVYTYQQVAACAREGARWASVHSALYHRDTGKAIATPSNVWTNAIKPMAVGLDQSKFSPQPTVTWDDAGKMPWYDD